MVIYTHSPNVLATRKVIVEKGVAVKIAIVTNAINQNAINQAVSKATSKPLIKRLVIKLLLIEISKNKIQLIKIKKLKRRLKRMRKNHAVIGQDAVEKEGNRVDETMNNRSRINQSKPVIRISKLIHKKLTLKIQSLRKLNNPLHKLQHHKMRNRIHTKRVGLMIQL